MEWRCTMNKQEMLTLYPLAGPYRRIYFDNNGHLWEEIPEETCEECGREGCLCNADTGQRLCASCFDTMFDVTVR